MQAEASGAIERSTIVTALKNAAASTGSDFHYLLGTAMRESSLRPAAQSSTSSATGLFQFVDQTWLELVKTYGAQHGLTDFADHITKGPDGRYCADPHVRESILALRKDPQISAIMAGEYAKSAQGQMQASLGRPICGGELYAAHFLGADAACKLIRLSQSDPNSNAAAKFPQAANANKAVFFHPDGQPKTVREVYDWATRQPGKDDLVPVSKLSDISAENAWTKVEAAQEGEVQMLLASLINWQPERPSNPFSSAILAGAGLNDNLQSSPLSFGPGLLSVLSDARTQGS